MTVSRDKEIVTKQLEKGAELVATQARKNAVWSRRIRAAISVKTENGAVTIEADGAIAPLAKAYEGYRGRGIRHPLNYKNQIKDGEHYFAKTPYRPYMSPAWDSERDKVADLVADGMRDALNEELK